MDDGMKLESIDGSYSATVYCGNELLEDGKHYRLDSLEGVYWEPFSIPIPSVLVANITKNSEK